VLAVRSQTYVEAMRSLGAGPARIMLRTILPNITGPLLVQVSLTVAAAIILESGLSFLGLGAIPPAPSWGLMIGAARSLVAQAPQLLVWPCLALTLTILAINALCDGLRDFFDPLPVAARRRTLAEAILPARKRDTADVLDITDLDIAIATPGGDVPVVRRTSMHVAAGETLAVVGESGSGKTLTSLAAIGLLPEAGRVTDGTILLNGRSVARLPERDWQGIRGREISMVFQDHSGSLNPVHRVGRQIAEALTAHRPISTRQADAEAVMLMRKVGIPDPERRASAYPHELSGGQRQRIMIAIALANQPSLVVADEPTTALDVTVQAQILDLLSTLQRQEKLSMVFVSHNLPVVGQISDRVAVMYAGEIVETGDTKTVFDRPRHPYTAGLLSSVPRSDGAPSPGIPGNLPSPALLPPGCAFQPRCPMALDACRAARPELETIDGGRQSRCIRWREM
jgi:peptide/nickel transport system permease protein